MLYQAVIFDLDGTILDTLQDLANSLNYALEQQGFPKRSLEEVRAFIGNGVRVLVRRGCPAGTPEEVQEQVFQRFLPHYDLHCKDLTRPYEGIHELLDALREQGIVTAVVSNKIEPAVKVLCQEHFPGQFTYQVGNRPDLAPKPAPDSVLEVLKQLEVDPSRVVYVGDTEVDVETARNAGLDCIGVDWGFRGGESLRKLGVKYLVQHPMEILQYVE